MAYNVMFEDKCVGTYKTARKANEIYDVCRGISIYLNNNFRVAIIICDDIEEVK